MEIGADARGCGILNEPVSLGDIYSYLFNGARMSHNTEGSAIVREQERALLDITEQSCLSRRQAMKSLLGLAGIAALLAVDPVAAFATPSASKETLDKLSDAQSQFDAVQKQLNDIADQYTALSEAQNKTLNKIEGVQSEIDATQAEIDKKKAQLEKKQNDLGDRVAQSYKNGGTNALMLLLNSASFEELIANAHYVDKINASDRAVIEEVRSIKSELDAKKADLENQKSDLESLKETQAKQMSEMQAKQNEVQSVLSGLSDEVKQLMEQRDSELAASAAAEAEIQRQQKAAAAAAAKKNSSSSGSASGGSSSGSSTASGGSSSGGSGSLSRVLSACHSVGSPGAGMCAAWVSNVFRAAGLGFIGGNANDMYNAYCGSSNRGAIKPGMIVAVSSHAGTVAGRIYGHVGIYVGNGTVMDNIGYIRTISLDSWISYYSSIVTPRWGWLGGIVLS